MKNFDRQKIKSILIDIVSSMDVAKNNVVKKLADNTLDCFSAVIDSKINGLTVNSWIEGEKVRQLQKTLQNKIGDFHQKVISTLDGVENLGTGNVVDIKCEKKKIVAEIKNKWNTTKGNHMPSVYDDLEHVLKKEEYKGYTGYYVEILPKGGNKYDKPFIPSDNKKGEKRAENKLIRVIDGVSFYEKMTGDPRAMKELYDELPKIMDEILKEQGKDVINLGNTSNIWNITFHNNS